MSFMTWKKSYNIGIKEIDEQHKKMFAFVNDLHKSMSEEAHDRTLEIAKKFSALHLEHEITEEKYLRKYDCPHAKEHILEHERSMKMANSFREAFAKKDKEAQLAWLNFLREWILTHIIQYDMQCSAFRPFGNIK